MESVTKGTDAPCVDRRLRFDIEEARAAAWERKIEESPRRGGEDEPNLDGLLQRWSKADAHMLQAKIVEEQRGDGDLTPLYDEYNRWKQERDEVQMEVSELPLARSKLFQCRVRQYQIMRERAYDLAMGRGPGHAAARGQGVRQNNGKCNPFLGRPAAKSRLCNRVWSRLCLCRGR